MRLASIALVGALSIAPALISPARAQGHESVSGTPQDWSFNGPFGTFDRASAQRGFQVYKEVCSSCHSMKLVYYRNLAALGFSDDQVKAIAASVQVPGGTDETGQPVERTGLPSDHFRSPFPNDTAARAANAGALPPDQSLIIKARSDGSNYVYALLNGYVDPPEGFVVPDGQYYNKYFPGHLLAMPPVLNDDQVTYADGTPATVEQMSRDVIQFLTWTSNPDLEQRKRMGVKVVLFLTLVTGLTVAVKKRVWKNVH